MTPISANLPCLLPGRPADPRKQNRPRSRALPLFAAALSFVYHLALAILANYVPLDRTGAALSLWLYSWTACVVGYFGLIAIIAVSYRPNRHYPRALEWVLTRIRSNRD